ncbi:MAG TPA: hypothetical protein VK714_18975, partial [Myxococcota bacterium]|nr:hypothetical protein [Myxococcota bacterium]
LRETQGDLTYDFHYVPTYQAYSRFANLDDWDQLVNSTVTYQLGLSTQLQVKDLFEYTPVTTNFLQQLTSPAGVPLGAQVINAVGRYNVLVNSASIDLTHKWSELWVGDVSVTSFYIDPKIQDGISSNVTSGSGSITYALTQRDFIGAGLTLTAQQFGSNSVQNATSSYFYNLSGIWNHDFSPTWSLKMQAGPTYVQSGAVSTPSNTNVSVFPVQSVNGVPELINFAKCPKVFANGNSLLDLCGPATLPAVSIPNAIVVTSPTQSQLLSTTAVPLQGVSQGSQTSLTYFANILMTKRWETLTATLGYARSAGTSGVFNSSTEIDSVTGSLAWTASPVWTTSLTVIGTDQSNSQNNTSALRQIIQPSSTPYVAIVNVLGTPVAVNATTPQVVGVLLQQQKTTINVYQVIIGLHSEYKLTKRLSVFGNFFYLNQSSSQNGGQGLNLSSLNYDATRIDLGFHYEFDSIHL